MEREPDQKRIEDVELAWEMAEAEDPYRSQAAELGTRAINVENEAIKAAGNEDYKGALTKRRRAERLEDFSSHRSMQADRVSDDILEEHSFQQQPALLR